MSLADVLISVVPRKNMLLLYPVIPCLACSWASSSSMPLTNLAAFLHSKTKFIGVPSHFVSSESNDDFNCYVIRASRCGCPWERKGSLAFPWLSPHLSKFENLDVPITPKHTQLISILLKFLPFLNLGIRKI